MKRAPKDYDAWIFQIELNRPAETLTKDEVRHKAQDSYARYIRDRGRLKVSGFQRARLCHRISLDQCRTDGRIEAFLPNDHAEHTHAPLRLLLLALSQVVRGPLLAY